MAVCDDCGAPIKTDKAASPDKILAAVHDHYELAHPGMPRYRYTVAPGKSYLACADPDCDEVMDASKQYSKRSGQDKDPIDRFGTHLESHLED